MKRVISTSKRVIMLALVLTMALGSLACATGEGVAGVSLAEVEDEIVRLVNIERAARGLPTVTRSETLDGLAEAYSQASFSEEAEEASDIRYLICNTWSVTYALSPQLDSGTASEQVTYCLEQPSMSEVMLRSEARETGVGVAVVGNTVYYTQVYDIVNSVGGDGEPVVLYENPEAVNPYSWDQLKEFLAADNTDAYSYIKGSFVCTDFAETLHNHAEQAGIRCAYVTVGFPEGPGHALSAFSVDSQLVYIDVISGDKVAYIEVGERYGVIAMEVATSFHYAYFEWYAQLLLDYLDEREEWQQEWDSYDQEDPTPDQYTTRWEWYQALQEWDAELDAEAEELGMDDRYFHPYDSLDVVDSTVVRTYIHW